MADYITRHRRRGNGSEILDRRRFSRTNESQFAGELFALIIPSRVRNYKSRWRSPGPPYWKCLKFPSFSKRMYLDPRIVRRPDSLFAAPHRHIPAKVPSKLIFRILHTFGILLPTSRANSRVQNALETCITNVCPRRPLCLPTEIYVTGPLIR